ncbi:hypothetical protein HN832_00825 [archaeon]|jgi:translation initiation factor 2 subunit 1|nr:hypothetical protein [archaeon]MBT4373834.1 hypothetical protein [archaeon]MBT4532356.1 hypothetical protein [archaeon]MBT7001737.1 hypothetical protein [archaeon]MBT7281938.1 hypothetical protein [archaeon]
MANLEVNDIVLCTVDRIMGTIVFVKIDNHGEGSIVLSEIAPGRIRNLRDYVVPKKQIICKVIRIKGDRIELSLRRVTPKEQKELKEKIKQEKSYRGILKSVLGEKVDEIISKIKAKEPFYEFMQNVKEDSKELEKLIGKKESEKILEILKSQKEKKVELKKEITLKTTNPNGLELIKEILGNAKEVDIRYISAGKYNLKTEAENIKKADNKLKEIIIQIEKQAKENNFEFNVKEK